jgi:hypothetical protein
MIMAVNESEYFARLSWLSAVGTLLLTVGVFTKITG